MEAKNIDFSALYNEVEPRIVVGEKKEDTIK